MYQAIRLNPKSPKMSACSDFVEHIWKPGSCKNCFCLRSDHQLSSGHHQPRAGSLPPPPRLSPRPEHCRLEDEGVNSSPYSKPTIAVKPTMLSSDASDVWTEANMNADVSKVSLTNPCGIFTGAAPVVTLGDWLAAREGCYIKTSAGWLPVSLPQDHSFLTAACLSICSFRLRTSNLVL